MAHVVLALAFQAVIGLVSGDWWLGAAFSAGLYLGREQAQAEYRWIERFGGGRRANLPFLGGFDPRVWNRKALLDCLLPAAAVVTVGVFA